MANIQFQVHRIVFCVSKQLVSWASPWWIARLGRQHTLQRSQACPVRVLDWRRFLTELEKSSDFVSSLESFPGVPVGEDSLGRLGGIGDVGTEYAALLRMEEAVEDSGKRC